MNQTLITTLRDKKTSTEDFRAASEKLSYSIALQTMDLLGDKEITIETPIKEVRGVTFEKPVVIVPILRAGLAMLSPFLQVFTKARVGFIGLRREELSAIAHRYYENIPEISENDQVILIDPMLATGGSAVKAVETLIAKGAKEANITAVFLISAPEGISFLKHHYPKIRMLIAQEDERLTSNKFIEPGLGDYGDRFFGTI